ncbi:MAG TPA: hypothetical protein VJ600_10150 [Holophagaceae bacterium]|nr:hypothetical protein [Holophagaceae bacterium]
MRAPLALLALAAGLALPLSAQASARFIKVDIVSKSGRHHHHKGDGPTEVHMRTPITLATSLLQCAEDSDIKINGETKKGIKADELIKMLTSSKPGDLLLELDTNDGDHIKVTVE